MQFQDGTTAIGNPVTVTNGVVVAALHAVDHLTRMGELARHIAKIARLKHPNPMISGEVRPVCARMGLLTSQLAVDAATVIEHRDALSGDQLADVDDEVGRLRRSLFGILLAQDWAHGCGAGGGRRPDRPLLRAFRRPCLVAPAR